MNKKQGDKSEALAIFYYTSLGYIVSKPLNHSSYYDLIVDNGEQLIRVECKSSRYKENKKSYAVSLRTTGGNQSFNKISKKIDSSKVDKIFILDGDGYYYVFESSKLNNRSTVNVNKQIPECLGFFSLK
jgi:hypothetical protein